MQVELEIIEEIIAHDSKLMVFKSINGLDSKYMSELFTNISQLTSHNLHNATTDLWLPQKRA